MRAHLRIFTPTHDTHNDGDGMAQENLTTTTTKCVILYGSQNEAINKNGLRVDSECLQLFALSIGN